MCVLKLLLVNIILISKGLTAPRLRTNDGQLNGIRGPEQVHISYGDLPDEMIIVWSTSNMSNARTSLVTYGLHSDKLEMKVDADNADLKEGNPDGLKHLHRAVLKVSV